MALSNEDLQAISELLKPINDKLDKMENRLDKMENRLEVLEVKQDRLSEQLTEVQLSQKLFVMNANKKFARLQDGIDTMEEILKMNELIPR